MPSEKTEKSGKKIARRRSEGKERENSAFNKSATRFFYTQASTAIRGQGCSQRDSNILTFSRPTKKRSEKGACLLACVGVTAPFLLPSFFCCLFLGGGAIALITRGERLAEIGSEEEEEEEEEEARSQQIPE